MALKVVQISAFSGLVNGVQVGKTPPLHFGQGPEGEKLAAEFGGLFYRLVNKQMPPGCPHHNPA